MAVIFFVLSICLIVPAASQNPKKHGTEPDRILPEKMENLEQLLSRQDVHIRQLQEMVSALTARITTQEAENKDLRQRVVLLEEHKSAVHDAFLVPNQEMEVFHDTASRSNAAESSDSETEVNQTAHQATASPSDSKVQVLKTQNLKSRGLTRSHDVSARSDDGGPLETVVNQLAQRVTEMSAEVQTMKTTYSADIVSLKSADQQHTHAIQEAASSVYTRWGRTACPSSNSLVYSGVVGGDWYKNSGAATNYLCLTMTPVLFSYHSSALSQLYGAEYYTGDSHEGKNAVCSVCRSPRPTLVMVPGTNVCWPGWTLEYSGFLMAGNHEYTAGSEYICVDSALENTSVGDGWQNGAYLAYTRTYCGYSLPCTPYVDNKLVTCAVCSK